MIYAANIHNALSAFVSAELSMFVRICQARNMSYYTGFYDYRHSNADLPLHPVLITSHNPPFYIQNNNARHTYATEKEGRPFQKYTAPIYNIREGP